MSRESQHTHFEDKIQEQVRLWGFPPTCASLMTTANNYFVMADHCKQIFSDSWPLQISILMADKYFLDGWPPKIYFMADHCKYSYWWLTSTDTDIEIGPMHVFTLKADKGKYLYWWLSTANKHFFGGWPLQILFHGWPLHIFVIMADGCTQIILWWLTTANIHISG